MEFRELTQVEYEKFLNTYEHSNFLHSTQALAMKSANGFCVEYVGVVEGDTIISATPLIYNQYMRKFIYAYAPRGILTNFKHADLFAFFVDELKQYLKKKHVVYLKMDPYIEYQTHDKFGVITDKANNKDIFDLIVANGFQHQGFTTGFSNEEQVRWMYTISMEDQSEESLLKQMTTLCRRNIRKSQIKGIEIKKLAYDELEIAQNIFEYTGELNNFYTRDLKYLQDLYTFFDSGKLVETYVAQLNTKTYLKYLEEEREDLFKRKAGYIGELTEKQQKKCADLETKLTSIDKKLGEAKRLCDVGEVIVLSAATFILFGNEVIYLNGGSYREYMHFNSSFALQWKMICYALDQGYRKYNFYGISGVFSEDASDYGVLEFKQGFGGQAEELLGSFILPIYKAKYKMLSKFKK